MDRYEVRVGKFGAYLHDTATKRDMTLDDVRSCLNEGDAAHRRVASLQERLALSSLPSRPGKGEGG